MSGRVATERLYYIDAYQPEFTARVIDRADGGRRIYLDRTAFYPTSGGQPYDTGIIASSNVVDVIDEGDRIAHLVDAPFEDDDVRGKIYWPRRFDNMQQHTGQHLLSALFDDLFQARTVSVHFGDHHSTVDVEIDALSPDAIEKVEQRANLIVGENRPVTVTYEESAAATGLRKAVDREGTLRIITIDDLDKSACGGTHVRSTGEIGAIHLRSTERVRKAMRVEFVCGLRAVARARSDYQTLTAIAATMSTSLDSVASQIARQAHDLKENEGARRHMEKDLARYRAADLHAAAAPLENGLRVIVLDRTGETIDQVKTLAQALLDRERVILVAVTTEGGIAVAASGDSGHDAGALLRDAVNAVGGKGGGSPRLAQGSVPAEKGGDAVHIIRDALTRGR